MKRYIHCAIDLSNKELRKAIDGFILGVLESDVDSHSFEINSPEHAAIAGLYRMKDSYEEAIELDELDYWLDSKGLPADFKMDKNTAIQLKPLFVEVASKYSFDVFDDSLNDWD